MGKPRLQSGGKNDGSEGDRKLLQSVTERASWGGRSAGAVLGEPEGTLDIVTGAEDKGQYRPCQHTDFKMPCVRI